MKKRSVQSGVSNLYTFWTSKILGRFFDEVESLAPTPEICPSDGSHFIYGPINAGRWDGEVIMSYIQLATSSLEEPISQPFAGKNRLSVSLKHTPLNCQLLYSNQTRIQAPLFFMTPAGPFLKEWLFSFQCNYSYQILLYLSHSYWKTCLFKNLYSCVIA